MELYAPVVHIIKRTSEIRATGDSFEFRASGKETPRDVNVLFVQWLETEGLEIRFSPKSSEPILFIIHLIRFLCVILINFQSCSKVSVRHFEIVVANSIVGANSTHFPGHLPFNDFNESFDIKRY